MLPYFTRVLGLTSTLSVKLAQDDLYIVKDLEIPTQASSYIEDLIKNRKWGPSVLFVDSDDFMPENITAATDTISYVNLMPVYGKFQTKKLWCYFTYIIFTSHFLSRP